MGPDGYDTLTLEQYQRYRDQPSPEPPPAPPPHSGGRLESAPMPAGLAESLIDSRACRECGASLPFGAMVTRLYCSSRCRSRAARSRRVEEMLEATGSTDDPRTTLTATLYAGSLSGSTKVADGEVTGIEAMTLLITRLLSCAQPLYGIEVDLRTMRVILHTCEDASGKP